MPRPVPAEARRLETGPRPVLFVEGHDEFSFDPHALRGLLRPVGVSVVPVGGCENVMAAVHALSWEGASQEVVEGSEFYSVVDRDHRADSEVELQWANGPFAQGRHLVWRRHEFENYFLEPEFIAQSDHFRRGDHKVSDLWAALLETASARVFLDAANLVIKELRAHCRRSDPGLSEFGMGEGPFDSAANAEGVLLTGRDYAGVLEEAGVALSSAWLRHRLHDNLGMMFGGSTYKRLSRSKGEWPARMEGRPLIGSLVSPRFFLVEGSDGKPLTGKGLARRVARDLMRRFDHLAVKPQDLVELRGFFARTYRPQFGA